MKKLISTLIIGLLLGVAMTHSTKTTAQQKATSQVEVLWAQGIGHQVAGQYHYDGLEVYNSSGPMTFAEKASLAEALAQCLNSGYTIRHVSDNGLEYVLVNQH